MLNGNSTKWARRACFGTHFTLYEMFDRYVISPFASSFFLLFSFFDKFDWSSGVASVVLPQFCAITFSYFFFLKYWFSWGERAGREEQRMPLSLVYLFFSPFFAFNRT